MDRVPERIELTEAGFPHTRGDGPNPTAQSGCIRRFSPHAWGWTCTWYHSRPCANSFPHTRGDGPGDRGWVDIYGLFSPHAWGWTAASSIVATDGSVFPTRVGMDRSMIRLTAHSRCFPHTRGDGPCISAMTPRSFAFSPHAWGWTGAQAQRVPLAPCFPHTRGDGP
jgi:hypothetical protein